MKRFATALTTLMLLFVQVGAMALADNVEVISFGRITAAMPSITAEVSGSYTDIADASALLDNEKLDITSLHPYSKEDDSVCAYVLIDLSTSMVISFETVKENVIKYVDGMGTNDSVVLITFGKNDVNVLLNGGETKDEIKSAVEGLSCNEQGTLFYEALSKAYQMADTSLGVYDRQYVLAFSDGVDYQLGNTTYDEVEEQFSSHSLPLYAACSYDASQEAADNFGKLARASGGSISVINDSGSFDSLLNEINNVSIIEMTADSNIADGEQHCLSVTIGGSQIEQFISITKSLEDNTPPEVSSISYDSGKDSVVVTFSEAVDGSLSAAAYNIEDEDGSHVEVSSVYALDEENTVEIKTKDKLSNGTYSVSFSGITDSSQQKNPITGKASFTVEGVEEEQTTLNDSAVERGSETPMWLIITVAAVLGAIIIIAVVLIIVLSSRKRREQQTAEQSVVTQQYRTDEVRELQGNTSEVKYHVKSGSAVALRIKIKTGRISEQNIEMYIDSSLIVGRSDSCDIYIDDAKLSRQHFVIEQDEGEICVSDLQSKNGTFVNDLRISSRTPIRSGDKITAGLSDLFITF